MSNLLQVISFIVISLTLIYAYQAWKNNKPVAAPDQRQLQSAVENSILWLEQNREAILAHTNPLRTLAAGRGQDSPACGRAGGTGCR